MSDLDFEPLVFEAPDELVVTGDSPLVEGTHLQGKRFRLVLRRLGQGEIDRLRSRCKTRRAGQEHFDHPKFLGLLLLAAVKSWTLGIRDEAGNAIICPLDAKHVAMYVEQQLVIATIISELVIVPFTADEGGVSGN